MRPRYLLLGVQQQIPRCWLVNVRFWDRSTIPAPTVPVNSCWLNSGLFGVQKLWRNQGLDTLFRCGILWLLKHDRSFKNVYSRNKESLKATGSCRVFGLIEEPPVRRFICFDGTPSPAERCRCHRTEWYARRAERRATVHYKRKVDAGFVGLKTVSGGLGLRSSDSTLLNPDEPLLRIKLRRAGYILGSPGRSLTIDVCRKRGIASNQLQ